MNTHKGFLNDSVKAEFIKSENNAAAFKKFFDEAVSYVNPGRDVFCEISHYFSGSFAAIKDFGNGMFISDDPYESLLAFHYSVIKKINIEVYNFHFIPGNFQELKKNESVDFIYSDLGLSYEKLFSFMPDLTGLLKVGGMMAFLVPSYWFFRDGLSSHEKAILDYSMKNDKKWIFSEPMEPVIKENGAELVVLKKQEGIKTVDRLELAYISSLHKLHKAHVENNIAVLEVAGIPEEGIEIGTALLVIRKIRRTLTRENLFNV